MGIGHCDREFLSLHRSQSPVQRSSAVLLHPLLLGQVKRCWVVSYSITGNFDTERSSCCSPAEFIWKNIRAITQSNNHHHQKHRSICWWEIYLRRCGRNSVGGGFVSENIFIHSIGLREVLLLSSSPSLAKWNHKLYYQARKRRLGIQIKNSPPPCRDLREIMWQIIRPSFVGCMYGWRRRWWIIMTGKCNVIIVVMLLALFGINNQKFMLHHHSECWKACLSTKDHYLTR